MSFVEPLVDEPDFYRNAQGDEVIYVSDGAGVLESPLGDLVFRSGDYLVIPRGILVRLRFTDRPARCLIIESQGYVRTPQRYRNEHGQLTEDAPFSERDIRRPAQLQTRDELGEFTVVVKKDNRLTRVIVDHHPFDVVGWDGYYYPWAFNIHDFEHHLFGLCLVNDWSARDMQAWEYQPLGPFLAKNFATTVSPWVVTMEALAPFRVPAFQRPQGDPVPLPYLDSFTCRDRGGIDLELAVHIRTAQMREQGLPPVRLSRSNLRDLYWTMGQLAAHHASNGCNMLPGDLLASGTVSGPTKDSRGCLLELAWRGSEPVDLPTGERRAFLEDGDEVILTGRCARDGAAPIGFGECRGIVLPA